MGNVRTKQQYVKGLLNCVKGLSETGWHAFIEEPITSLLSPDFLSTGMEKQKMEAPLFLNGKKQSS